ncbi:uncharacterized protein MYCFIDRAFT_207292 [Pseudocercospora fijiensis CIRAD86]|uniref:Uncharacterized protein n=1 Tax=Pseudocercospora fijiensis (strain CIRAD86) TaxID=383855 RepID=M3B539_PSEFD|nr:uncharacterized protein MYCFIDRAFT_207292 [Pseudocercospora fijiensis CIRAD86]EME84467.1 hypothetical protein MYCFIDRAFT_207292 [Pseudocercospora fijiensis CIRAD86]
MCIHWCTPESVNPHPWPMAYGSSVFVLMAHSPLKSCSIPYIHSSALRICRESSKLLLAGPHNHTGSTHGASISLDYFQLKPRPGLQGKVYQVETSGLTSRILWNFNISVRPNDRSIFVAISIDLVAQTSRKLGDQDRHSFVHMKTSPCGKRTRHDSANCLYCKRGESKWPAPAVGLTPPTLAELRDCLTSSLLRIYFAANTLPHVPVLLCFHLFCTHTHNSTSIPGGNSSTLFENFPFKTLRARERRHIARQLHQQQHPRDSGLWGIDHASHVFQEQSQMGALKLGGATHLRCNDDSFIKRILILTDAHAHVRLSMIRGYRLSEHSSHLHFNAVSYRSSVRATDEGTRGSPRPGGVGLEQIGERILLQYRLSAGETGTSPEGRNDRDLMAKTCLAKCSQREFPGRPIHAVRSMKKCASIE